MTLHYNTPVTSPRICPRCREGGYLRKTPDGTRVHYYCMTREEQRERVRASQEQA